MANELYNKITELEKKVELLEQKLNEKVSGREMFNKVEGRFETYGEPIRSEKGEMALRKNLVIKNRKGKVSGYESGINDSIFSIYFNNKEESRFNHIFLGTNSAEGDNRCAMLQGITIHDKDAPNIQNNGAIQFALVDKDKLDEKGGIKDNSLAQLAIQKSTIWDRNVEDGELVAITGTGKGGAVYLQYIYYDEDEKDYKGNALVLDKNGIITDANFQMFRSLFVDGAVFLRGLPTTQPETSGQLWNSNGTIKIS